MGRNCGPNLSLVQIRRQLVCVFFAGLLLIFSSAPALAHKVMIFAWVEGDTVYTQSKFGRGRKAKDCTVVVYDKQGSQLLEGKTNEKGEFSFKIPKPDDLRVVLKASMGHMAEWKIPAEEISGQADVSGGSTAEAMVEAAGQQAMDSSTDVNTGREQAAPAAVGLSRKDIQALIDESLEKRLVPVVSMIADSMDRSPGLTEVIGGIGYIFGLVGVALYFANRRKKG